MSQILATADIGSNTVHLLVAMASKKRFRRLLNESEWLSLGEIVRREKTIPAADEDALFATLKSYAASVKKLNAEQFYVFATEAMRQAENHEKILKRIESELGVTVDLVSGRREAELGLRGALLDSDSRMPTVFVEAGGGSVQVAEWDGAGLGQSWSLPIGTGALIADAKLEHPSTPHQVKCMERLVEDAFSEVSLPEFAPKLLCSGGVARGLWRALHPDGDRNLHIRELDHLIWDVQRLSLDQIVARYRVKTRRGASLLPGAVVYRSLMHRFDVQTMEVSVYGVREGVVAEMLEGRLAPCPA